MIYLLLAWPVTVTFQIITTVKLYRHGWPIRVAYAWSRDQWLSK